ncbi:hypothetical protein CLOP_g11982 [Closterium sp. NIES-67]|nr:hypothetical protein CLOP_g11982 [Closterium sp. NIES-67]
MAGRRVAYVGDKAVANAFDSMLCMLAQADTPTALPDASPRRTLLAPSEPPTTRTDASKGRGGGGETSPRQAVSGGRQGESVRAAADGRVFIGALDAPPSALHAPHAALDAPLAARAASMVQTGVRGSEGAGSDVRRGGGRHKKAGWGWNPIRWGGWRRASSAQQHVGAADAGTGDASSASGSTDHTSTPPAAAYSASFALFDMQPLLYVFPRHNVTLAFLPSPFLVKASLLSPVNATLCQLQRAAAATALNTSAANSSSSSSIGGSTSQAPEHAEGASPAGSSGGGEGVVRDACYPNRIHVDEPDPAWAQQAALFDAVVLASGRSWTEDAVETHGLSVVVGGVRQSNLSVEGLVGQWAYPLAMAAVTSWLANASHFNGTAVFRSFSPTHPRKQCAARMLLPDAEHASEVMEEARRYDDAVARAIGVAAGARGSSSSTAAGGAAAGGVAGRALPRLHLMNVSLLTAQRADAHPWMASPVRPKADCTDWCLPGVPDTWNELLAATLLKLLQR